MMKLPKTDTKKLENICNMNKYPKNENNHEKYIIDSNLDEASKATVMQKYIDARNTQM